MSSAWDELYVYGAGGHGKVVADVVLRADLSGLRGFIDDACTKPQPAGPLGLPLLGSGAWLAERAQRMRIAVALGLGDNRLRQRVAQRCLAWGIVLASPVHPRAAVAPSARLGAGTVIMAGAAVNPDATLGAGVIINTGAVVEHDNEIGDYAHLSANATTGGQVRVGALAQLGLGAVVLPRLSVGCGSIVGAGAVVVADLPEHVVAVGVPARILRRCSAAPL